MPAARSEYKCNLKVESPCIGIDIYYLARKIKPANLFALHSFGDSSVTLTPPEVTIASSMGRVRLTVHVSPFSRETSVARSALVTEVDFAVRVDARRFDNNGYQFCRQRDRQVSL